MSTTPRSSKSTYLNEPQYTYGTPSSDTFGYAYTSAENPLLANRLFSLGLDEWARNAPAFQGNSDAQKRAEAAEQVRIRLRRAWPFELDATISSGDHYDQVESQGLLEYRQNIRAWRGDDSAFLRALPHDHIDITDNLGEVLDKIAGKGYLPSGGFPRVCPRKFQAASGMTYVSRNASRRGKAT